MELKIAYDHELSTEINPKYFVYSPSEDGFIYYKGSYMKCLAVVGGMHLDPTATLAELDSKMNGFLFDK